MLGKLTVEIFDDFVIFNCLRVIKIVNTVKLGYNELNYNELG